MRLSIRREVNDRLARMLVSAERKSSAEARRASICCLRSSSWAFKSEAGGKRNGFASKLLPCARRRLHALQAGGLFRIASCQAEKGAELRIQVCCWPHGRAEEKPVAGQ